MAAYNPPKVSFSESSPEVNFGQIRDILIGTEGQPLSDMTLAALEARIDNRSESDAQVIRRMTVIAKKDAPDRATVELSHKRKAYGVKKHKITGHIDDTNDTNYEFLRLKGTRPAAQVAIWYLTESHVYGGTAGILSSLNINHILPESNDEVERFEFEMEFEGVDPERHPNPLATANND